MSLEKVQSVVQIYIDSMKEASAEKVKEAFHPNGSVVGHLHGDFLEMSTDDFAGFVSSQEPSDIEFEILSTEICGTTASVKVRDKYLGITFLDTLSLVEIDNEWSIYSKLFHVEE
tara:strand:- start:883 stop:1227 length:345 start_codon:yes stop_codon:yes gene_type:complete